MLITILIVFACCFVLERVKPGWELPVVKTWPLRVLAINGVQLLMLLIAGLTWERWLSHYSLFDLSQVVSDPVGGMIAYFIATFVFYWWHRYRHRSHFLWKYFHQIHHSPQRLEVITSFYKHPLEMCVNSIIGSLIVFVLLGLSPTAAAYYTLFTALGEFFYHTSVRTPRWIGFFFQRPEMHRIHHQYRYHNNNFGDITWWDMMFGTYENPKEWDKTCGFDDEKEQRLLEMLQFKDVHVQKKANPVTAAVLAVVIGVASFGSSANACSVFAESIRQNEFVVGKNFDWLSAEGFVIENPRGAVRKALRNDQLTWIAEYGSIVLSPLGPGLPASGMNEKGLVVEALLDFGYRRPMLASKDLTSLEWAQYVLDRFASLTEVVQFSKQFRFQQMIVPIHFFVCDQKQNCGVFELREGRVRVLSGKDLPVSVLANGDWKADHHRANNPLLRFISKLPLESSPIRFKRLADNVVNRSLKDQMEAFRWLNSSAISSMNQWQIVWEPIQRRVTWRVMDDKKKPQRLNFSQTSLSCKPSTAVRDLARPGLSRRYTKKDAKRVRMRVLEIMEWRSGNTDLELADEIATFTLRSECK